MKLSAVRIQRTLDQLEDHSSLHELYPLPADSPAVSQLNEVFGEHTFFLDSDGLHIVEPAEPTATTTTPTGKVIKLAAWTNKERKALSLSQHRPEVTGIVVILGADEPTQNEIEEEPPDEELH
jgi:hypothetical protein